MATTSSAGKGSASPLFIAAGYSGVRLASDDGRTWKNLIMGREGNVFRSLTFGNGLFLASGTIGGPGLQSVTSDGIVWRTICTPETKDNGTGIKGNAFGNGKFITFGGEAGSGGIEAHNNLFTSSDGLLWADVQFPTGKRLIRRIAFGNGVWVGVGDYGRRAVSEDAVDWHDAPDAKAVNTLVDIAFGNGVFVGVGLHSLRMITRDGKTWTDRQVGEEGEHLNSIAWCGDRFVAVGPQVTYSSPDGVSWKRQLNRNGPLIMAYASGQFIGSHWKGRLLHSADGVDWEQVYQVEHHIEALGAVGESRGAREMAPPGEANLVKGGDTSKLKSFLARYQNGQQVDSKGSSPPHWNLDGPAEVTSGDFFVPEDAVEGTKAIGLRKSAGGGVIQIYQDGLKLSARKRYVLSFEYCTSAGAGAARLFPGDQRREKAVALEIACGDTLGKWRAVSAAIESPEGAEYRLSFQCYGTGTDKAIYFRNISVG